MLAYIVQFRRQTAPSGGLSKNSPLPHAQIWGLTPNFKILFYGDPHPLQIPKFSWQNLRPFLRNIFFKNLSKSYIFGGKGEIVLTKFKKKIKHRPPYAWSKFGRAEWSGSYLYSRKTVFPIGPMEGAPINVAFKGRKNSDNGVGWCWFQYSSTFERVSPWTEKERAGRSWVTTDDKTSVFFVFTRRPARL